MCKLVGFGRYREYKYLVMSLVGKSLDNLKKDLPGRRMSFHTGLRIAKQMVDAIKSLHEIGSANPQFPPRFLL